MSIAITINSGDDKPFAVDIERFPTKITVDRTSSDFSLLPLGLFLLGGLYFILSGFFPAAAVPVSFFVGVVLAALLIAVIRRGKRQHLIRFEEKRVIVKEVGRLKDKHWQAKYSEFQEVIMRKRTAKSGKARTTYQIIELKHQDAQKTLPLFVDMTQKVPTQRWEFYADLFRLPATKEGY